MERAAFHPLVHSPNGPNGQSWVGSKLEHVGHKLAPVWNASVKWRINVLYHMSAPWMMFFNKTLVALFF